MIAEDDKTPAVVTLGVEVGKTPRPVFAVPPKPPLRRPTGALSVTEMTERITLDVRRSATAELERKSVELRGALAADVKTATSLAIAALIMNVLGILGGLVLSGALTVRGVGLGLVAVAVVGAGALKVGARRASSAR